jgi:hypothetical protein
MATIEEVKYEQPEEGCSADDEGDTLLDLKDPEEDNEEFFEELLEEEQEEY